MRILEILMNSIKNNRVAHAYLFEGAEDSDKLEAANAFAQALLCENAAGSVSGTACGKCAGCLMFMNKAHPNYHFLSVEGDTIKIREHMEPFFADIRLSSPYSTKKVYIINNAHKMNSASQNSILKTLEEPHSDIIIILLTENSNLLLQTIMSRVIRYTFNSKSAETAAEDEEVKNIFFNIIKNLESPHAADRISASQQLSAQKENCKLYLEMLQEYYRNSLVAKYTKNDMLKCTPKTDRISPNGAICAVKIIDEIKFALKSNVNIQIAMDVLVTKLNDAYKQEGLI